MRDDVTFETRLAEALGRYSELAPPMDDVAIARQAISAGRRAPRIGWLASLGRRAQLAYLLIVLVLLLAAILVAVAGGVFRNDSFRPLGRNGAIVFTVQGNDHGPADTHLVNADGTGDRSIDTGRCPTYSKDGAVLTSLSYSPSAYLDIWDDAGNPVRHVLLVNEPSTSVSYALSPDGVRVAWFNPVTGAAASADSVELWLAPVAGGPAARILPASNVPDEFYDSPLWSPDGGRIAFGSYVADTTTGERRRTGIHVVAADGADLRLLTTRPALIDDAMSWSPDGRFLAYLGLPDGPPVPTSAAVAAPSAYPARDLFLIGADGAGDRNLTGTPASENQPEWSPDGSALAFDTSADGEAHRLTTIRMNGPTPASPPVLGPESEWFAWSPDGTQLLWLEVDTVGPETYRSTLHAIDPEFRGPPMTLQAVDGLIVCPPSWQRLEP